MKKIFTLFILIFVTTGCIPSYPTGSDIEPNKTDELTYKTVEFEDETESYAIHLEYPQFSNSEEANKIIENMMTTGIELFKNDIEVMELNPEDLGEYFMGKNGYYVSYEVYTHSENLISVAFYNSVYWSGAAHPMSYTETFNYDLNLNRELNLLDFFVPDADYAGALSYTIIPKLKEKLYEDEFAMDDWIENGAGPDPENFQQFTLTDDSFIFHFDPYVVAAYAAGPQRIEVSFSELYAILIPPWNGKNGV